MKKGNIESLSADLTNSNGKCEELSKLLRETQQEVCVVITQTIFADRTLNKNSYHSYSVNKKQEEKRNTTTHGWSMH